MSESVQQVQPVVRARALVKRFGSLVALDGVDLEVDAGECVGVLGPADAGKTVLVRTLYGRTPPDAGSVRIFGLDLARHARRIRAGLGVVPQEDDLDPSRTVSRDLVLHGRFFGRSAAESRDRTAELLAFLGVEDRRRRPIADLPVGTRRRAAIARALLHAPALLLVDGPTAGLGPRERRAVHERLRALHRAGKTILLATRDPDEAALLCDRVVLLDHGKVLESGTPADLVGRHAASRICEFPDAPPEAARVAESLGLHNVAASGRLVVFPAGGDEEEALAEFRESCPCERARIRPGGLQDVFLRLTGRDLEE